MVVEGEPLGRFSESKKREEMARLVRGRSRRDDVVVLLLPRRRRMFRRNGEGGRNGLGEREGEAHIAFGVLAALVARGVIVFLCACLSGDPQ